MRITGPPFEDSQSLERPDDSRYREIINQHLEFIATQCRKALGRDKWGIDPGENEALELNNMVLDKLQEKNYQILRRFQGNATIGTYLTAIISRQAVDFLRQKKGRNRSKERAKQLGPLGEGLYQKVVKDGQSISHAHKELQDEYGFNGSPQDLEAMIDKIKGNRRPKDHSGMQAGYQNPESGEIIVPDPHPDPEKLTIESQRIEIIKETVQHMVAGLSGEERLILRMRFPLEEDEKPKEIEQISRLLGISKKAVYHRITRILKKCRDLCGPHGVRGNDLF